MFDSKLDLNGPLYQRLFFCGLEMQDDCLHRKEFFVEPCGENGKKFLNHHVMPIP
jgi:hypothetical protein